MAPYYKVFNEKTTIPVSVSLAGTITSSGTTITVSNGKNELKVGDFIYDISQNEIREVVSFNVNNPIIESAFTSDISSPIALKISGRDKFTSISVTNIGVADGQLNNNSFKKRTVINYSNSEGLDPITINGTGTQIAVSGQ